MSYRVKHLLVSISNNVIISVLVSGITQNSKSG